MSAPIKATEGQVDELEKQLKSKVESQSGFGDDASKAKLLMGVFKKFDEDKSGVVELVEFHASMVRLNFVGVDSAVEGLFERYDQDASGTLSYEEFAKGVFNLGRKPVGADKESRSIIERVKQKVKERGGSNGIRSIGRLFKIMDDTGDKKLDKNELLYGMKNMGVTITDADLTVLFKHMDADKSGLVSFDEFMRGVRGKIPKRRRKMIKMAFDTLDKDGSGVVNIQDIQGVYDVSENPKVHSGEMTTDQALAEFLDGFDSVHETGEVAGEITWEEFFDYYKDISASVDDDDYFELMIRNAWHISGGEGAAANTSNRRVMVVHTDGSETVEEIKNDLGLAPDDVEGMKKKLFAQGIEDIVKISLV